MTVQEFLKKYPVTAVSEWAPRNPHMKEMNSANHYKVTLKYQGRRFTLYYSKGMMLHGEPTAEEVILTLAMDFSYIENGLDDFADSLGYDHSEAKRIFNTIETQGAKMFKLLGFDAFQDFKQIEEEE